MHYLESGSHEQILHTVNFYILVSLFYFHRYLQERVSIFITINSQGW